MYHISLLHAQESWLSCQWEKQLQGGSGSSMTPAKQETTVWDNVILRNYKYYKLGNFGTFCCMLLNQNTDRLKNTSRSSSSFRLGLWQQNRVVEEMYIQFQHSPCLALPCSGIIILDKGNLKKTYPSVVTWTVKLFNVNLRKTQLKQSQKLGKKRKIHEGKRRTLSSNSPDSSSLSLTPSYFPFKLFLFLILTASNGPTNKYLTYRYISPAPSLVSMTSHSDLPALEVEVCIWWRWQCLLCSSL